MITRNGRNRVAAALVVPCRVLPGILLSCLIVALSGVIAALSGCTTGGLKAGEPAVLGMVYRSDFRPCANAQISIDGKPAGRSDYRGRFEIASLDPGRHELEVEHPECQPQTAEVMADRTPLVVHVTLVDNLRLEEKSLDLLRRGQYGRAREILSDLGNPTPPLLYLRAVAVWKSGDNTAAARLLRELDRREPGFPAVEKLLKRITTELAATHGNHAEASSPESKCVPGVFNP